MAITNIYLAESYANNPNMARAFIRMNGYSRIEVQKHHLGEPGWQTWLMSGESTGTYDLFRTKREAMTAARKMSEVFELPIA